MTKHTDEASRARRRRAWLEQLGSVSDEWLRRALCREIPAAKREGGGESACKAWAVFREMRRRGMV